MLRFYHHRPTFYFLILLLIYALLGLLNLHVLPIAWTDEVMNLDPALQWHKTGKYAGFLWPNSGSDNIFLSYPPLVELVHIFNMYFLPFDIYWIRFPFLMVHLCTAGLLFLICREKTQANSWIPLFLCGLFLFDKVVFEISRSMRVEVLESLLVVLLLWLHIKHRPTWMRGIVLGLLLLAHLKMWPLVLLYLAYLFFAEKNRLQSVYMFLIAAIPVLLFCWFVDFRFAEMYQQMFVQAGKHQASGNIFVRVADFVFSRFWPVYKEQPWALAISLVLLLVGFRRLLASKGRDLFSLLFVGTSLAWIFLLAPHYRYWPPLYLVGLAMLASEKWVQNLAFKKTYRLAILFFIPLLVSGFLARHYLAWQQRAERDPGKALTWLRSEINTGKKTLLVGEGIGFYFGSENTVDYGMDMYPQNLHPERYQQVYFISRSQQPLKLISDYKTDTATLPLWFKKLVRGETYSGLKLYQIHNASEWQMLTQRYQQDY